MRKFLLVSVLVISSISELFSQTKEVWMIGPMVHFNIGHKKYATSFGIEVSYWNYNSVPYSIDGGIEFERHRFRLYTEAQTGIGVAGFSLGPALEFRFDESKVLLGFQRSVWINYFAGVNLRWRTIGGATYFCPGLYGKLPFGFGETSGSNDDHDWDWDD